LCHLVGQVEQAVGGLRGCDRALELSLGLGIVPQHRQK
jgi:hypothetical protein